MNLNQYIPSRVVLLFRRLKFYIFGEKFYKKFNYDWHKYSHRFDIINNIIKYKKYNSYLEIGCQADVSFKKILAPDKIGVDPMDGGTHRMTSDDFFKTNQKMFDLIFIDGLHEYSQVLRDIKNSVNVLNKDGIILVHDCLPAKIWHQTMPQTHSSWNGDVWKAIVECRTLKNIDTYTCVADQGLGIIFNKKNTKLLEDEIRDFKKLTFKDYYQNHNKYMNLIDENELYNLIK
ncbi:class I SAM-dependent methyltransferase [Candidatus Pelagibacter bacterium]|nr:class I SAM-dependent methyltransferase [Candidatus Pelagibacter bacterium]